MIIKKKYLSMFTELENMQHVDLVDAEHVGYVSDCPESSGREPKRRTRNRKQVLQK